MSPTTPRVVFALGSSDVTIPPFTVPAAALGTVPVTPIDRTQYPALVEAFALVLRTPADDDDAAALAMFALCVIGAHFEYGRDALRQLAIAIATFPTTTVALIADPSGAAFAISNVDADLHDLRCRLAMLEVTRGCHATAHGQIGEWPTSTVH